MGVVERAALLDSILRSSTECSIVAQDLEGKILAWNDGARRIYGYDPADVVGIASVFILHHPDDVQSGHAQAILDDVREIGAWSGELRRVRKDGNEFAAFVTMTLRRDAAGQSIGFTMISRDLTDQRRLEHQIRERNRELEQQNQRIHEANRLKSEFLANMSHELRTPLNGVIGLATLMYDEKVGAVSADHKEYLGDILTSSRHLLQLINDVLDLAKVESGKTEFHPMHVDVDRLVIEVCDILRTFAAERRIRVACTVEPSVQQVVTDPGKLKQVLYNYLSNALKFTPDDGRVYVRVLPEGPDQFRLEVEDTGVGIRAADFGGLFVEFHQLDASTAKQYQGTGLGLALTRRIIEAQGGRVGVTSTLGRGSTFFAVLPRVWNPLGVDAQIQRCIPRPRGAHGG